MSNASPAAKEKKKGGKLIWVLLTLTMMAGAAGGAFAWTRMHAPQAAHKADAIYIPLDPAFVVNLSDEGDVRYLQADVQVMTRDPKTQEAIAKHLPVIRNRLLMLFGQQSSMALLQRPAKEKLQQQALDEVRAVLKGEGKPAKVESVFFTSFVTQ